MMLDSVFRRIVTPALLACALAVYWPVYADAPGVASRPAYAPAGEPPLADALADPAVQRAMLALARRAFDAYARDRAVIDPPADMPPVLFSARCGVFVSTMRWGAPRTCMGTLFPAQADLADEIIENAEASAGRDLRFPPVRPTELVGLNLIISVIVARAAPDFSRRGQPPRPGAGRSRRAVRRPLRRGAERGNGVGRQNDRLG